MGATGGNSPTVHRTPSTPMLGHGEYFGGTGGVGGGVEGVNSPQSRESLAELWQNFLEQEAAAGGAGGGAIAIPGAKSRQGSTSLSQSRPAAGMGVLPNPR